SAPARLHAPLPNFITFSLQCLGVAELAMPWCCLAPYLSVTVSPVSLIACHFPDAPAPQTSRPLCIDGEKRRTRPASAGMALVGGRRAADGGLRHARGAGAVGT